MSIVPCRTLYPRKHDRSISCEIIVKQQPEIKRTLIHPIYRINAPGALRIPSIPSDFDAFTGPKVHTAEWDDKIDLKGKKVAIIGSGASAVQVIPSIVDSVESLHCYQRKPPYILPRPQFNFPNCVKNVFTWLPCVMWLYRTAFYLMHEVLHNFFKPDSILHKLGEYTDRCRWLW